jgi:hypothetical protein
VDAGRFWEIIETARASARRDRLFHEALTDHLAILTEQDILEYYERFEKMHGALYRRDLWAAAYLIGGGCSDDSFIDFRAGLITQGHDWYHKAAAAPDSLANHPAVAGARHPRCDNPLFYEEVNYAASAAFQRLSGDEQVFWDALAARAPRDGLAELGEDFDFDDDQEMRRRLPRLFRSIHSASRDLSSTAWLTNKPRSLPSAASKGPTWPRRGRSADTGGSWVTRAAKMALSRASTAWESAAGCGGRPSARPRATDTASR